MLSIIPPPLQADVEYCYHRLSRLMLSIVPPPLQADVEYCYHRLSRLMLSIVPPPLQADVEYCYHRLSRLMLSIVPPPLQADNHLWFQACDYECSCTLIAFLISFITYRNLLYLLVFEAPDNHTPCFVHLLDH
ncbi:hypothetical protein QL285_071359 [Trifolium repens]|nr:hypothetical protein QL285_071358 [Trifolium repens]KAK2383956.1 hypothetical protein QL285_071359 [Trifolium repens]